MKICIPTTDDRGLGSEVYDHFGSARFFTIVDVDDDRVEVVRNPECHDHPHSCHHIDILKAHGITAVVCRGVGRRAHSALQDAEIEVLVARHRAVADLISAFKAHELHPLSFGEACGGGRRGGHGHQHGRVRGYEP